MALSSKIEWTEATWNPVTGCTKISEGCRYCYAERLSKRLQAMGNPNYAHGFEVTLQPHMLDAPMGWKKHKMIFVNSMSDLFHKDVPTSFIEQVFQTMVRADQHHYQVLTKRADRLAELAPELPWPDHIWAGVSVENQEVAERIDYLRRVPAKVRFLSMEPLLGPLPSLNLRGISWAIVGGESGPGARPMAEEWVRQIQTRCLAEGVPFFFKQWGGVNKKKAGRLLDGRTWDDMPSFGEKLAYA